jgi:integrase
MARITERLTAIGLERLKAKPGMHPDGNGLYLQVKNRDAASWVLRYMLCGKARYMGLGPLALFGLSEARAKALDARRLRHDGADPIEAKRQARVRLRLEAARAITFKDAAERYIKAHKAAWKNGKHSNQWPNTLATYVEPVMGALPVGGIDTALVLKVLEPIWTAKNETAKRVRGRIEAILDWAKVHGYREGENPARWRGHLDKLLPSPKRVRRVKHHEAMPYAEIGEFMARLRGREAISARALDFTILTAVRTEQTIGARWLEIDPANKIWIVPAERMKGTRETAREHRVPLSSAALEVLERMRKLVGGKPEGEWYVFPGTPKGKTTPDPRRPLSNMAMLNLLQERMGHENMTVHGFRSTFKDWATERTNFANEVSEMSLAHTVEDKVEGAYRRGDLFEKRRRLMEAWAAYCATLPKQNMQDKIAPLRRVS